MSRTQFSEQTLTPADVARRDQAEAREREQGRLGQMVGAVILTVGVLAGAYAYAAASGMVPAMPWSPIGQVNHDHDQEKAPSAPAEPQVAPEPSDGGVNV